MFRVPRLLVHLGQTMKYSSQLQRFLREEDGPTAVEYAVILALIVLTCMTAVTTLANKTKSSFDTSADAISSAL